MQKRFFKFIVTIFILFEALSINIQDVNAVTKKISKNKQQAQQAQQKKKAKKIRKANINNNIQQNIKNQNILQKMKKDKDLVARQDLQSLPKGNYINVASWNMWLYSNGLVTSTDIIKRNRVKLIEVVINRMRPDIFMAQETLNQSDNIVGGKILGQLQELSKKNFDGFCSQSYKTENQGNCIFWNSDMFSVKTSYTFYPINAFTTDKNGTTITHNTYQHEPAFVKLSGSVLGQTKNLCLYSFHISFYSNQAKQDENIEKEIGSVLETVEANNINEQCDKYIIGGDFNKYDQAIINIATKKNFTNYKIAIGGKTSRSNSGDPASNYDHFIYSSSLSNKIIGVPIIMNHDVDTIEKAAYKNYGYQQLGYKIEKEDLSSDHYPIFMRLKFK